MNTHDTTSKTVTNCANAQNTESAHSESNEGMRGNTKRPRFSISTADMKPDLAHYCKAVLTNGLEATVRFKRENGRPFLYITNGWYPLKGNGYGSLFAGSQSFKRVYLP